MIVPEFLSCLVPPVFPVHPEDPRKEINKKCLYFALLSFHIPFILIFTTFTKCKLMPWFSHQATSLVNFTIIFRFIFTYSKSIQCGLWDDDGEDFGSQFFYLRIKIENYLCDNLKQTFSFSELESKYLSLYLWIRFTQTLMFSQTLHDVQKFFANRGVHTYEVLLTGKFKFKDKVFHRTIFNNYSLKWK